MPWRQASDPDRALYSIGAASRVVGVPVATLRSWQERYGVVVPDRSPGGHRLYSREQLEYLKFLADQVASGLTPGDAHRLLSDRLDAGTLHVASRRESSRKLMILLAERDPFAAELEEYFLRTEGHEVSLVLGADDALAKVHELKPDIAIVDLLISGASGMKLCAELHERFETPVLAISTLDLQDEALEAGAAAFLQKPVKPLVLVSTVQDLLRRSAFVREAGGQ